MEGTRALRWYARLPAVSLAGCAGCMAALWSGLLLAELGHFAAWPVLLLAAFVTGCIWLYLSKWQQDVGIASTGDVEGLAAACALALLALVIVLPPSELLLGGWDPGVYLHTASALSRTGELLQHTPDLAALDAESRLLIGRQGQDAWEPFLGMRMLPDGRISPQFYHLYPVLMALAWPLGGVRAALLVNPLLYVFSIILMYLWACRWVRPRWAFAAALLLALNPAQVWQAGFGTSELLAQCLLLLGLVATDHAFAERNTTPLPVFLAGASFGLLLLTKYEAILFVVPFAIVLLFGLRTRAQRSTVFILVGIIAMFGAHAGVHQIFFAPLYHPMGNWVLPGLVVAGGLTLLIALIALLTPPRRAPEAPSATVWRMGLRLTAVFGFVAWVVFAWYVRPRLTVDGRVLRLFMSLMPGGHETDWFAFLAGRNARNFWYLRSLFGGFGLLVSLTGVGLLIMQTKKTWRWAWLVASVGVLFVLMTQMSHEPFMMFVSRRMVPVVLPLFCLGGAFFCDRCEWGFRKYTRHGLLVGVLVVVFSLWGVLGETVFLARHREWPGLTDWLDQLATSIPEGAIVYSDAPGFAAPLRFLYGIPAYEVHALHPGERRDPMAMMIHRATGQHDVFWLTQATIPAAYEDSLIPAATLGLASVIQGSRPHKVPQHVRPRAGIFVLYRILDEETGLGE